MKVYERLRDYIFSHELKIADIADKTGLSVDVLEDYLHGEQTIYPEDLRAICYALNVTPEHFM